MEKSKQLMLFGFILSCATFSASAQIYVQVRPSTPVVIVTEQPKPTYVWIDEEWKADGPNYRYVGGYWGNPPSAG